MKRQLLLISIATLLTLNLAQAQIEDREAFRAAFEECATKVGLPKREPGTRPERPSPEIRELMDACLAEKGFEPPQGRGEGGRGSHPRVSR